MMLVWLESSECPLAVSVEIVSFSRVSKISGNLSMVSLSLAVLCVRGISLFVSSVLSVFSQCKYIMRLCV